MKSIMIFLAWAVMISVYHVNGQDVVVEMKTEYGSIIVELYPEKAPITCANFIKYIEHNRFDGVHFYRVVRMDNQPKNNVKIEVIQGGLGPGTNELRYPPIVHETTRETGVLHKEGTISMARVGPGTATSEFFICIGDQPSLDFEGERNPDGQGFAAFGKVVQGMETVKLIQNLKDKSQRLLEKVEIYSIAIIKN